MNENSDNISLIRTHLQEQSTEHLVDLLIDLVQAVDEPFAQRYFVTLKESRSAVEFYEEAISYLAPHDAPYRKHMDNFMALVWSRWPGQSPRFSGTI
jgi:hypothetical protein